MNRTELIAELTESHREHMARLLDVQIQLARVSQDRHNQEVDRLRLAAHRYAKSKGAEAAAATLGTPEELSELRSRVNYQRGAEHRERLKRLKASGEYDQIRAEQAHYLPLLKREYQPQYTPPAADLTQLVKRAGSSYSRGSLRPFVDSDGELKSVAYLSAQNDHRPRLVKDGDHYKATFLISTPDEDRVGDIVRPKGLIWDDYRKNSIVLWNHGQAKNIALPIGTSTNPATGEFGVRVGEKSVEADVWFANDYGPAEDIAKLVDQGIIKAASIHMIAPIVAVERKSARRGSRPALDVRSAGIAEWSCVDIPCNQAAVRKAADTGRLCGEALCDEVHEICKSMVRALPAGRLLGVGWSPEVDE